jgi:hypothetical protein
VATDKRPIGKQYRETYQARGDPALDSEFFRVRLYALLETNEIPMRNAELLRLFTQSMGIRDASFDGVVQKASIERLLSFITVLYEVLTQQASNSSYMGEYDGMIARKAPATLIRDVGRLFREEGMAYEIDEQGGIHPLVDSEFQRNRHATLISLSSSRYTNVDHSYRAAFTRLTLQSFDTKAAVRDIFDAAESLFKLMLAPRNPDLNTNSVESDLRPMIDRSLAGSDIATKQAFGRTLSSFGKWADACHPYRHGQQSETIVAPPSDLATLLLGQGASFIRWLAAVDQSLQGRAPTA